MNKPEMKEELAPIRTLRLSERLDKSPEQNHADRPFHIPYFTQNARNKVKENDPRYVHAQQLDAVLDRKKRHSFSTNPFLNLENFKSNSSIAQSHKSEKSNMDSDKDYGSPDKRNCFNNSEFDEPYQHMIPTHEDSCFDERDYRSRRKNKLFDEGDLFRKNSMFSIHKQSIDILKYQGRKSNFGDTMTRKRNHSVFLRDEEKLLGTDEAFLDKHFTEGNKIQSNSKQIKKNSKSNRKDTFSGSNLIIKEDSMQRIPEDYVGKEERQNTKKG